MMEQWNSRYAFMTDEQIAEGKRKQQAAHDRLISAIPPAVTKEYQHGYDAGFEVGNKIAHKQEPVAFGWRDVAEELPTEAQEVLFVRGDKVVHGAWIGGIFWHSNTKMAAAKWMPLPPVDLPPLFAAPVVQPGMVIVPRDPTHEMVSAGYSKITMEIENSSRDISDVYRAMIAAAEGKK